MFGRNRAWAGLYIMFVVCKTCFKFIAMYKYVELQCFEPIKYNKTKTKTKKPTNKSVNYSEKKKN